MDWYGTNDSPNVVPDVFPGNVRVLRQSSSPEGGKDEAWPVHDLFFEDEAKMKTLKLAPVYGYGWREGTNSIDVPKRFSIKVFEHQLTDDKKNYTNLGNIGSAVAIFIARENYNLASD